MPVQAMTTTDTEKRFGFGENWLDYLKQVNDEHIESAVTSLKRFYKPEDCVDKTFLDIGCGSGLFSLAALRLGFKKVFATDIDENCIRATSSLLSQYAPRERWECQKLSVFDLDPKLYGQFDSVYSWGVLHHTEDMEKAISIACQMVKPEGIVVLALYRKTLMCGFWKWEKRMYNNGPAWFPAVARSLYKAMTLLRLLLRGRNIRQHIATYKKNRGMSWHHDIVDWLGGYPYDSISPDELRAIANRQGFEVVQEFTHKLTVGLFGSGCDEYSLRKK